MHDGPQTSQREQLVFNGKGIGKNDKASCDRQKCQRLTVALRPPPEKMGHQQTPCKTCFRHKHWSLGEELPWTLAVTRTLPKRGQAGCCSVDYPSVSCQGRSVPHIPPPWENLLEFLGLMVKNMLPWDPSSQ